jgi:tetratricopeptide (TPR) repeat protein
LLQRLLAETLVEQNDIVGAVSAFEAALAALVDREDVAPSYRDAIRQRMAMLYLERDQHEKVRALLADLEMPEGPLAYEIRCRLAIREQSWDEARKMARRLAVEGKQALALLREGEIAAREEKWDKASSRFAKAIEALGDYQRAIVAEIYLDAGRPDEGVVLLREWTETNPELADARFHLGVYYYEIERFEEADRELREAFRLDPAHARALNFLGYSLAERKMDLDEALEMIESALDVDSWNGAYLDSLGWVFYQMGRYDEARQPLERAARELPNDSVVLEHLGDLYLSLGDTDRAVATWNRALEADHADPEMLLSKIRTVAEAVGLENPLAATAPAPR